MKSALATADNWPFEKIGFCWGLGTHSGWGTYALNFAVQCARQGIYPAIFWCEEKLYLTDQQQALVGEALKDVPRWNGLIRDGLTRTDFPFFHALRDNFEFMYPTGNLRGSPNVGVIFFDVTNFTADALARANSFDLIVTGSAWNKRVLEQHGLQRVVCCPQGVDLSRFSLRPRQNHFPGRFTIFSGGKLEFRKGQDIAIAAFKIFQSRHPEALLVTAWNSPWPEAARTLALSGHVSGAPSVGEIGELHTAQWLMMNGLPEDSFYVMSSLPNTVVPDLLKEVDLAIFPNRSEGGTNLVAMECMAMAVPIVLSRNTGHLDLICGDNCYVLDQQRSVGTIYKDASVNEWGESSVSELVDRMEDAFGNRVDAAARGAAGRAFIESWDWSDQNS